MLGQYLTWSVIDSMNASMVNSHQKRLARQREEIECQRKTERAAIERKISAGYERIRQADEMTKKYSEEMIASAKKHTAMHALLQHEIARSHASIGTEVTPELIFGMSWDEFNAKHLVEAEAFIDKYIANSEYLESVIASVMSV